ncbi:MAG TPA: alpha/beta hydrolase-fold protein [Gemmataceae bacterium]|nr:alpha/beta hydrolase-fold protein [Gemmataceae bacterium]
MIRTCFSLAFLLCATGLGVAQQPDQYDLAKLNQSMAGRIDDFTHNHGRDNRITSTILSQKRDLYVYVPPDYNPAFTYPLVLWLHGAFVDEHSFLTSGNVEALDRMIASGRCPPMIVACPDGTYTGQNRLLSRHSLYLNGEGGAVEDHIMQEVLPFLFSRYSITPGRDYHGIAGISAGGAGAMSLALRHRDLFSAAASTSGVLNLRYDTASGDYFAPFSPDTFRWKTTYQPWQVGAKFGLMRVHARFLVEPIFGRDPGVIERVKRVNPADLLELTDLRPGELRMYVRYGDKDEINCDGQGASFVWLAGQRGVPVDVESVQGAKHAAPFFRESSEQMYLWLGRQFEASAQAAAGPVGVTPAVLPTVARPKDGQ